MARFCERKKGVERDAEYTELDPLRARFRRIGPDLGSQPRQVDVGKDMGSDRKRGNVTPSTGAPESDSGPRPEMIPVLESSSLSARLPSPHAPLDRHKHLESSPDETCAPFRAPRADETQYGELTWRHLRNQCSQRCSRRNESKAVLKTRLTTKDAAEAKRNLEEVTRKDGKRERAPMKGVKASDNPIQPADLVGKRERAPAKKVAGPNIPTQFSDSTRGGGNEGALGSGKGNARKCLVTR